MPTKLYMTNKLSEYVDTVPRGSWDDFYVPHMNFMIDPNKYGSQVEIDTINSTATAGSHFPNVWGAGTYRGISRRLAPQTIDGYFDILMFVMGNVMMFSRVHIFILDTTAGDNAGTVFAELRTFEDSLPYTKEVAWSTEAIKTVHFANLVPLSSVVIPNDGRDYRLVVEFGAVSSITTGMTLVMTQQRGARKADLTGLDDITVPGGAPAFYFSNDLLFKDFLLPINHEIEFATELFSLPTDITVSPYKNHPLWWKCFINQEVVISALACNATVRGKVRVFSQSLPDKSQVPPVDWLIESNWNGAVNHAIVTARYVYCQTWPESAITSFNLHWDIIDATVNTQVGDFLLTCTDSIPNMYDPTIPGRYPTMIRQPDGSIRTLSGKFTSSNLAVALYAGRFGMVNAFTKELFIYGKAPDFPHLSRIPTKLTGGVSSIGTDFISFFVVGKDPNFNSGENRTVYRIDYNGVFYPDRWRLPTISCSQLFGCDRGGTRLYYGDMTADGKIYPFDLGINQALAPFPASPGPTYAPLQVIVMSDGSIVALFIYFASPGPNHKIYHYKADGTLLNAFTLSTLGSDAQPQYMTHHSDDNPNSIWLEFYSVNSPVDRFVNFNLTTGFIDSQVGGNLHMFQNGAGPTMNCNEPVWGPQYQGAMVMMMLTPGVSGIYALNSALNHDSYYYTIDVKIPDPTVKTALIGE